MTLLTHRILRFGAVTGAVLLTVACAETQLGAQAVKEVARTDKRSHVRAKPGPELAPDAFDVTGLTIWDGASTLEGVWVAHPLAERAQRVRVTNEENDLAIEGAMFRRDPTLSGPSILVSSDAARLLGLQPGIPTGLRIIALREGVYAEPTAATAAAPAPSGAVETAALPAPAPVEIETVEAPPEEASEVETTEAEPVFERANDTVAAELATPEPVEVAEAPAPAQPTAVQPTAAQPAAANPRARQPAPPKTAITAADLRGDTASAPTSRQPAPEPAPAQPELAQPAPAQQAAVQPAQAAPAGGSSGAFQGNLPSGQFVQAGAFGVEPNAATLVQTLRDAGLPAQYVQRDVNGSVLNIVMIGPLADDAAADAAVVAAAKAGAPGARKVTR